MMTNIDDAIERLSLLDLFKRNLFPVFSTSIETPYLRTKWQKDRTNEIQSNNIAHFMIENLDSRISVLYISLNYVKNEY